ncbi:hypothetical protein FOMG_00571 [Fusarium oxysporum f. sp. melonis 26406]|uniref:Uncharacterized protein n=1 Tax=Fusarium oxysporum f. sp. melonis 26406 TaxID=1089452 RepID=X0BPZ3_FUSOX|nr:hypothetical protein FOMG_00571 [Fusarium oxysporum f. sp. melonis 26406]
MSFRERDRISHRIHYCRAAKAGTGSTAADKAIGHGSHSTVTICACFQVDADATALFTALE